MRKILLFITATAAALTMVLSCSKEKRDYPIAINVTATGSISGNTFTDDGGTAYDIAANCTDTEIEDMDRALVMFDVLDKIGEGRFSIRVLYVHKPLCKEPVKITDADEETLVMDPVLIDEGWISGGYINLRFIFSRLRESETAHMINLVREEGQQDDTLRFTLRHNGFGEGFAHEGNKVGYDEVAGFVCFDVSAMVPDGDERIPVRITAPWYETTTDGIRTGETVDMVTRGILHR